MFNLLGKIWNAPHGQTPTGSSAASNYIPQGFSAACLSPMIANWWPATNGATATSAASTTARSVDPESSSSQPVEGSFRIRSPYFAQINPAYRWSDDFHPGDDPVNFGYLSPRYDGKAVVGFLDGHAGVLEPEQLKDMRYWSNWADSPNWTVPRAPQLD